ncbi:hypothetical protein [Pelistega sp. MC2]|uniref:hypothetical protein n=1 Tax=Pelistega sp. MC2 TaxID=1720297 RepID=UPI0008DB0CA2|nr:hypothetical protein [Pelistega sp. MC2]
MNNHINNAQQEQIQQLSLNEKVSIAVGMKILAAQLRARDAARAAATAQDPKTRPVFTLVK